jgi:hypothetical protein
MWQIWTTLSGLGGIQCLKISSMKKIIIVTILTLLAVDFVFAHYKAKANQRCRTFRKRYIAEASATEFGIGPRVWSWRCDNAHARAESSNEHALAQATANDSQITGFAWTRRWFARAGESNSNSPIIIDGIPENTKSLKEQSSVLEGIHIDPISGAVYISHLSSKFDIASDDQLNDFAAFRMTIVLEDVEDTLVAPIILEDNKAFFINGQLYLEGNFFRSVRFNEIPSAFEAGKAYALEIGQFIFVSQLQQGKDIAIYITGDVGNLRLGIPEDFITAEAKSIYTQEQAGPIFSLFPNPTTISASITISGLENYQGNLSVRDIQGNLILDMGTISLNHKNDELVLPLNTSTLQPNYYHLVLSTGTRRLFLRFKKE